MATNEQKVDNEEHVFNLFHKLFFRASKTRACGLTYEQKIHL
jgi:hypothetical protein